MDLLPIFNLLKEGTKLYSPLYSDVVYQKVRPFNPMSETSPMVIECKTMANSTVLFNNEGKAIVFHPSGEMIFETNMGECMIYPSKTQNDWVAIVKYLLEE